MLCVDVSNLILQWQQIPSNDACFYDEAITFFRTLSDAIWLVLLPICHWCYLKLSLNVFHRSTCCIDFDEVNFNFDIYNAFSIRIDKTFFKHVDLGGLVNDRKRK